MTFTTIIYALFLPVVFLLYHYPLRGKIGYQNILLLSASYFFYGFWDWRFLGLIIFSTIITYTLSLNPTRLRTVAAVVVNLCILVTFKYLGFFGEGLRNFLSLFGIAADWLTIEILLPVGVSFYTLQAISYSVDCYKREICPVKDVIAFGCYMAFFPQLVAGPIEKPKELLPQFTSRIKSFSYDNAVVAMRQILWGLFKKLAVADLAGIYVDRILDNAHWYSGSTVFLAFILFSFQLYADFSGYSDIAIGSARLFGIRLSTNFRTPFFSPTSRELWRKWHITLMKWFRDYVYIPLGGSRKGTVRTYVNILIVFILSGLWHGASVMFILWGIYCGLTVILSRAIKLPVRSGAFLTFLCFTCGMLFFRSETFPDALLYLNRIFSSSFFELPTGIRPFATIVPMMLIEYAGRNHEFAIREIPVKTPARWFFYAVLAYLCIFAADTDGSQFIYFAF